VPRANAGDEFIRHKNLRPVRVKIANRIHDAVEREQNNLAYKMAVRERFGNAVTHQIVALRQKFLFGNAEAV